MPWSSYEIWGATPTMTWRVDLRRVLASGQPGKTTRHLSGAVDGSEDFDAMFTPGTRGKSKWGRLSGKETAHKA